MTWTGEPLPSAPCTTVCVASISSRVKPIHCSSLRSLYDLRSLAGSAGHQHVGVTAVAAAPWQWTTDTAAMLRHVNVQAALQIPEHLQRCNECRRHGVHSMSFACWPLFERLISCVNLSLVFTGCGPGLASSSGPAPVSLMP